VSLVWEQHHRVAVIRLNRPEAMNAIDPPTRRQLGEAWERVARDDSVWVTVLTGTGDRAFCAGVDLKAPADEVAPLGVILSRGARPGLSAGMQIPKPIIAAVNGHAIGGGLELALASDIRICSENATFGLGEVKIASIPASGGTQLLPRAVPPAVAMKMLLTGEPIDAAEALRVGLVSDVTPVGRVMDLAMDIADRICRNGPLAVRAAKLAASSSYTLPLTEGLRLESLLWALLHDTEDRQEGRQAFRERRPPTFKGYR